jgi:hypothetical protein
MRRHGAVDAADERALESTGGSLVAELKLGAVWAEHSDCRRLIVRVGPAPALTRIVPGYSAHTAADRQSGGEPTKGHARIERGAAGIPERSAEVVRSHWSGILSPHDAYD